MEPSAEVRFFGGPTHTDISDKSPNTKSSLCGLNELLCAGGWVCISSLLQPLDYVRKGRAQPATARHTGAGVHTHGCTRRSQQPHTRSCPTRIPRTPSSTDPRLSYVYTPHAPPAPHDTFVPVATSEVVSFRGGAHKAQRLATHITCTADAGVASRAAGAGTAADCSAQTRAGHSPARGQ